jgi:hypothetical protein
LPAAEASIDGGCTLDGRPEHPPTGKKSQPDNHHAQYLETNGHDYHTSD